MLSNMEEREWKIGGVRWWGVGASIPLWRRYGNQVNFFDEDVGDEFQTLGLEHPYSDVHANLYIHQDVKRIDISYLVSSYTGLPLVA